MKRILVVNDLHCGSVYGILPPKFLTSDDKELTQNSGQKYLWNCWEHMASSVKDIDALVVNGDMIEGEAPKSRGADNCLPRMEDQAEAAVQCLTYLIDKVKPAKTYCLMGTPYHDSAAGREAEVIAQRLGAERYLGLGPGRFCRDMLDLRVEGVVLNFLHGASVSGGLYRMTGPDKEGVWSALAGKEGKAFKADCVIRAHAHYFAHAEHPTKHIVINGCWSLQSGYARKSSAYRFIPDIGYIVINVDGEAKKREEDPCRIEKKLYPLPTPPINNL